MEWSEKNKYNSFNSYKGLTYYEHYKKIMDWMDGKGELPPPIEVSLDPISACNQSCYYCNSQRYLREDPVGLMKWDESYIISKLSEIATWGVKAFCWGGGGEALLNENIKGATRYGTGLGMEASIITNGVLLDDDFIDELVLCRWIGISVDTTDKHCYKSVRGKDDLEKVLDNIRKLVKKRNEIGSKCDIGVKALILPETYLDLKNMAKVIRDLGVDDFHVRPVDLERKDYKGDSYNFDVHEVNTILDWVHEVETEKFHVYTVKHKYDSQFHVKHDFNRCLASPLVMQVCTDKNMYVCLDHRNEERFRIDEWGSDQHRKLVKSIDPHKECSRCTWSEYNRQMEECIIEDRMCRNFP